MTTVLPQKKANQNIYDFVIVGAGLSGLLIATAISRQTKNVLLIDQGDSFGGHTRAVETPIGFFNNGLRFLPDTDLSKKSIEFLENLLEINLNSESIDNSAMTFEAGGMKPFVGFGENPPPFYEELSYFLSLKRLKLLLEPHEWTQVLFNNFKGEFLPRSYVTKFHGQDEEIQSLTINGQKNIFAHNFIFCGAIKDLQVLLPQEGLSSRARQKMSKSKFWTAICLDILHSKKITENLHLHVLNGTTQDEVGPCVGLFQPATDIDDQTVQYSQWISFIDNEDSEDTELVGHSLKKIKRQIKRAYPDALDEIKFERILVAPSIGGNGELKLNSNQTLPTFKNFWVASGTMNSQKNILGSLLQAELVLGSLGFNPIEVAKSEMPQSFIEEHTVKDQLNQEPLDGDLVNL